MSFDFDEAYYLKSKLQQLIKTDAATYGNWNTEQVKQAIQDAGMTVEQHYQQYSLIEGTSGNPFFNTTEYLEAKLAQLKSIDNATYKDWTVADVVKAFQDAGFTSAEDHYNPYGCKETDANGYLINPSNAFDANAYVQAKLAQLVKADPETYGDWTAEDVAKAIADAGMTPVEHYEEYGKAEGAAAGIDMVQTVPVTQRVANDELRDGMDENVPSNYNKPVDAPKNVDASEAGSVDKPCDISTDGSADESVPVPGDADYIDVPGGGIKDTNENPVELVSNTVQNEKGETVVRVQEYGVATTTTDENGVKTTTVQPVDENGNVLADADPIKTQVTDGDTKVTTKNVTQDGTTVASAKKEVTNDDGSTVTDKVSTATDADGNQIAKEESRVAENASGEETGRNSTFTDEDGNTTSAVTGEDPGKPDDPTPEPTPDDGSEEEVTPASSFTVTVSDTGDVEFGGSATGDVEIGGEASALTFTRGGTKAATTVDNSDVNSLPAVSTYISSAALLTALNGKFDAAQALTINDPDATALAATDLSTIGGSTTGTVTVSNAVAISGTTNELTAALVTEDSSVVAENAKVTDTEDTITAAALNALVAKCASVASEAGGGAGAWSITDIGDLNVAATTSADTFVLDAAAHTGSITGFSNGTDKIGLGGATGNAVTAATGTAVDSASAGTIMWYDTSTAIAAAGTSTLAGNNVHWAYATDTKTVMHDTDGDWTTAADQVSVAGVEGATVTDFIVAP